MPNVALVHNKNTTILHFIQVIDGYLDETHKVSTGKTDEPVEDGYTISDHAIAYPARLKLKAFVSDQVDIPVVEGSKFRPPPPGERVSEAWLAIVDAQETQELLEVFTPWAYYQDMLIIKAEAKRLSGAMECQLELEQVRIIDPELGVTNSISGPATTRGPISGAGKKTPQSSNSFVKTLRSSLEKVIKDKAKQASKEILTAAVPKTAIGTLINDGIAGVFSGVASGLTLNESFSILRDNLRDEPYEMQALIEGTLSREGVRNIINGDFYYE